MKKSGHACRQAGFTIIELLVAISIMSVLSVIAFGQYRQAKLKANDVRRKADLNSLYKALLTVYNDVGSFPSSIPWGVGLTGSDGTLYMKQVPQDSNVDLPYYAQTRDGGKKVAIFSNLENIEDAEYNKYCPEGTLQTSGYQADNGEIYHYVIFSSNASFADFGLSCGEMVVLPTNTPTSAPVPTVTQTPIPIPTATQTPVPIATPTSTQAPTPTNAPVPTSTLIPTNIPTPTPTSSCTNPMCYRDWDSDGDGTPNVANNTGCTACVAGYVANNTDCCDVNAQINPGAIYHTSPHAACVGVADNWDYDCNNTVERENVNGYYYNTSPKCGWSSSNCTTGLYGYTCRIAADTPCGGTTYKCVSVCSSRSPGASAIYSDGVCGTCGAGVAGYYCTTSTSATVTCR